MKRLVYSLCFLCSGWLFAADASTLPRLQETQGDYYASGKIVEISGKVNGDLYVAAGQVFIDGEVTGSVLVCGGMLSISGAVGENVRALVGQAQLSGSVKGNVSIVAGNVDITGSAVIGRNLSGMIGSSNLSGNIHNVVRLYAGSLRLSGTVREMIAYVGQLTLTSTAQVAKSINYWSSHEAIVAEESRIGGEIVHHDAFWGKKFRQGKGYIKVISHYLAIVMNLFYTLILGMIFLRFFPEKIKNGYLVLRNRFFHALMCGIIFLVVMPLICLVLVVSIVGMPFALAVIALNAIGFYSVKVIVIAYVARLLFHKFAYKKWEIVYFCITTFLYFGLTRIPFLNVIIPVVTLLLGLGAVILGKRHTLKQEPV